MLQEGEIRRVGDNKIRKIDVRVIAATNRDLEQEVKYGGFSEDLLLPAQRCQYLAAAASGKNPRIFPVLAGYFLEKICAKMKLPQKRFAPQALDLLLLHSWPGNVRQLENLCERMVIFSQENIIDLPDLPVEIRSLKSAAARAEGSITVPRTKDELKAEKTRIDRLFLSSLLEQTGGNVMEASRLSGMDRSQLHHLMSRFGLTSTEFKKGD